MSGNVNFVFVFSLLLFIASAEAAMEYADKVKQDFDSKRLEMVKSQIKARGIKNEEVLNAMRNVPRHLFVPDNLVSLAYEDTPINIGYNQTISQPYMVAFMTEEVEVNKDSVVLDIGTGSGYQAAILGEICKEVYSIEIVKPLGEKAGKLLKKLYKNVHTKIGDGYEGWPEKAPFDAIIIAASLDKIPAKLLSQLKIGGRIIMPMEDKFGDRLIKCVKTTENNDYECKNLMGVRFVPMTGKIREDDYSNEQ